jgi:hypothetical protein
MIAEWNPAVIDNLRLALQVLEERSGLGLDSEYAAKIRSTILHQIERGEAAQIASEILTERERHFEPGKTAA